MKLPMPAFAAAILVAAGSAPPRAAAPPSPWPAAARQLRDHRTLARAAADFPSSSQLQRGLLGAALEAKDSAEAIDALDRLAGMGATLSQPSRDLLAPLVGAAAMRRLAPLFDANAASRGESRVFATVPATDQLIEGLAWNARRQELYATSVHDRMLFRLERPGGAVPLTSVQPGGLFGITFDARRGAFWIAASVAGGFQGGAGGFNGVIRIDAATGRLRRIAAPAGAGEGIGDIAVARDGTVYASDGMTGGVFRCLPPCARLEAYVPAGTFFSAQGMVLSPDQTKLYIADYRDGLAMIDRATGRVEQVTASSPMMLDGIDGLVGFGGDLIAIQNGVRPARIVRLRLSRDGGRVERLDVLERANPAWGEPSLGTIAGSKLLYVSDSQWERFEDGKQTSPARPTPIRELSLERGVTRARR
jgi:hypothetical protein